MDETSLHPELCPWATFCASQLKELNIFETSMSSSNFAETVYIWALNGMQYCSRTQWTSWCSKGKKSLSSKRDSSKHKGSKEGHAEI